MLTLSFPILISFILYLSGLLVIGFYFYNKNQDASDYFLGSRKLGSFVVALSAGASDMSGWLLLGLPGYMYASGVVSIWIAIGLVIGAYLNWLFIAQRVRSFTEVLDNSITLPEYFQNRFEDKTFLLRLVSSIIILIFFTLYVSSGLVAGAKLLESTFNIPYQQAIYLGTIAIVLYVFLGGYFAVSWTDMIQSLLMAVALLILPVFVILELGGWTFVVQAISEADIAGQSKIDRLDIFQGTTFIGIISLMAWGLGYFGQPHILVRFMSIEKAEELKKSRSVAMIWMILSMIGALLVGFSGIAYVFKNSLAIPDSEKIFIELTKVIFNPWVAGIFLSAILSAIMSTIDSQLLVSASVVTHDIYERFFRKKFPNQRTVLWVSRISVIGIALIAFLISSDQDSNVLKLVAYAWAGFGATFGPCIIFSVFWKKTTKNSILLGMLVGAITVIFWKQLEGGIFGIYDIYEIVPGFLFCSLTIFLVSGLDSKKVSKSTLSILFDR